MSEDSSAEVQFQKVSENEAEVKMVPASRANGMLALGLAIGVAATAVTIMISSAVQTDGVDERFAFAEKNCAARGLLLEDEGKTLNLNTQGEAESSGAPLNTFTCIAGKLKMPSSARTHVGQTTAVDGRQTETWDGIEFSWSYHPDRGLDGVFRLTDGK